MNFTLQYQLLMADPAMHFTVLSMPTTKSKWTSQEGFPYFSSRGNEYVLIAYHYDANIIVRVLQKNYKQILL